MSMKGKSFLRSIHSEFAEQDALPFSRRDAHAFLGYALNVMHGVEAASPEADALVAWLSRNRRRLLLPDQLFTADDSNRGERQAKSPTVEPVRWQNFGRTLTTQYFADGWSASRGLEALETERALQRVTATLGFDELDAALFGVIFRYRSDNVFGRLFDGLAIAQGRTGLLRRYPDLFALLIGGQTKDVNTRFRADGLLLSSGAIGVDEDGDIHLAARLRSLVDQCGEADCDVRTELLGNALAAKLPWSAFSHLGLEIEVARAVLRRAVASIGTDKPEHGVHILLYGPPGTGKTECAQSLAAELGVAMHVVGEQSEGGQEPSRAERLSSLLLSQRVGAGMPALYLFDEAEDLFRPLGEREPDPKIFVHRLLETARVPMIWAANDLEAFSPAVLRRMTMCIEVRLPNQTRRAALWQELAKTEGVAGGACGRAAGDAALAFGPDCFGRPAGTRVYATGF